MSTQKPLTTQVLDGVSFAFPRRIGALKKSGKYDKVFALKERVEGERGIKEYLTSGRRQKYSKQYGLCRSRKVWIPFFSTEFLLSCCPATTNYYLLPRSKSETSIGYGLTLLLSG